MFLYRMSKQCASDNTAPTDGAEQPYSRRSATETAKGINDPE
jgi:hypothetical protein